MFTSVHNTSPVHVPVANATACTTAALAVTIIDGPCAATNGSIALMEHAASPSAALRLLQVRSVARDDASRECALVAAAAAASRFHKRGLLRPPANAACLSEAGTSIFFVFYPQHKVYGRQVVASSTRDAPHHHQPLGARPAQQHAMQWAAPSLPNSLSLPPCAPRHALTWTLSEGGVYLSFRTLRHSRPLCVFITAGPKLTV